MCQAGCALCVEAKDSTASSHARKYIPYTVSQGATQTAPLALTAGVSRLGAGLMPTVGSMGVTGRVSQSERNSRWKGTVVEERRGGGAIEREGSQARRASFHLIHSMGSNLEGRRRLPGRLHACGTVAA